MKRALAERAKQSLNAVNNSKHQQLTPPHSSDQTSASTVHLQVPQHPLNAHQPVTDADSNAPAPVIPSGPIQIKYEVDLTHSRYRRSPTAEDQALPVPIPMKEERNSEYFSTFERPQKLPRLDLPLPHDSRQEKIANKTDTVPPASSAFLLPKSPRCTSGDNVLENSERHTNHSESRAQNHSLHVEPQAARRNSLDPSQTSRNNDSKSLKKGEDEESDKSFYLKHQNRALATELKSLQHAVSQLETERDARRMRCHAALHAVNDIGVVWRDILDSTAIGGTGDDVSVSGATTPNETPDPPSTGTGSSVEWTRGLQNAIIALGQTDQNVTIRPLSEETSSLHNADERLAFSLDGIKSRAQVLKEWIRLVLSSGSVPNEHNGNKMANSTEQRLHDIQREMAMATARCSELEAQLMELVASRTDVVARERRVRRNIYRLSAGMLTPEQVINTLEEGEDDGELKASIQFEKQRTANENHSSTSSASPRDPVNAVNSNSNVSNLASLVVVEELRGKIASLEDSVASGENAIQELNALLIEKLEQISKLSKRQLSDENAKKLESLQLTQFQLKASQKNSAELQETFIQTKDKWAQSIGNEKAALGAVDELISKFNKRWLEFSNGSSAVSDDSVDADGIVALRLSDHQEIVAARNLSELQHKLNQALENVRQSEMTRESLKVALAMNGSLQTKLHEVKSKYAALRTSQNPESIVLPNKEGLVANALKSATPTLVAAAVPTEPTKSSASSFRSDDDKVEKLKYRRARKELAAMTASRDSSKSKFERAEKERDGLMESNIRLLKQMSEKDDMNAKSLSTILHLKSLTEKLSEERECLEQQMKSASQLALAARLATNAKERVSEEILKEKAVIEEGLEELKRRYQLIQAELERVSGECSEASGKMAVKESELSYAWKRSDELAVENEVKREEIRKLLDLVNKAERESREAKDKLAKAIKSGEVNGDEAGGGAMSSGASAFSVEQLQTQVSVLKNRLACPVCHYRDKECIILRCRHMHCKQCVDERISNRSRKCPTCNVKFSENEVGDIWLS